MKKFELPRLPYAFDALEPLISATTVEFHYDKHHRGYVDKLNGLVESSSAAGESLEELIRSATGGLFDNAAQAWNHTFYWHSLTADGADEPEPAVRSALVEHFGSVDAFKQEFAEAATDQFGSGWAWLVLTGDRKLSVTSTSNAGNPLCDGYTPLLTLDVWEHAYYLDYQHERAKYVQGFLDHLLNWPFVARNLEAAFSATARTHD